MTLILLKAVNDNLPAMAVVPSYKKLVNAILSKFRFISKVLLPF